MLKESVSEAEGTEKVAWLSVKPNTTSNSPMEYRNPGNSLDIACAPVVKQGKNYKKKKKNEEKGKEASDEGFGCCGTGRL